MVLSDEWLNEVWIAGFAIKDNRQMKTQVICGSNIKHILWRLKEMSVSKKKAGKEWLGVKKRYIVSTVFPLRALCTSFYSKIAFHKHIAK